MIARLREALHRAGLLPPAARVPYLRALVRQRGEYERSLLVPEIGQAVWRAGVSSLSASDTERAVISALGHGSLLAEFAMAPARPSQCESERIASLGARANLIVTAYDNLLDQGRPASAILRDDFSPTKEAPWVGLMAGSYFRLLGTSRTPLLDCAIRRMYLAEKLTDTRNPVMWRRKNALPFVVLGLGGRDYAHRAWLYRVGLLMGWIDDIVDSELDARHGRWNRFEDAAQLKLVTRLAQRVMEWWDRHARQQECRNAFLYCLSTWTTARTR